MARAATCRNATAAGGILPVLAHELERTATGSDTATVEGEEIVRPATGTAGDGEKIAADATAAGHDDGADQRRGHGGVDGVAAGGEDAQASGGDERMLRGDHAAAG